MFRALFFILNLQVIYSIDYRSSRTLKAPIMGWSTWAAFGCEPCSHFYYDQCLSDIGIETVAELLVSEGFKDVGYEQIIIDDCWQEKNRDKDNRLKANTDRFPYGIPPVSEYVHNKHLKLGIFTDLGEKSGQRFPGSKNFFRLDAETFASWKIDYVKVSAATADKNDIERDYVDFGREIYRADKTIIYATSWLAYLYAYHYPINFSAVKNTCNTWRFSDDMDNRWSTILGIMDSYAKNQLQLRRIAGEESWSDADLLAVGFDGITDDQARAQMAVWCIIQSSLIFSVDIRNLTKEQKNILQNRDAIAVNQDVSTKPGYRAFEHGCIDIWMKQMSPKTEDGYFSYAIAFVNRNEIGTPFTYHVELRDLGLHYTGGYEVTDLFASQELTSRTTLMFPYTKFRVVVNPSGVMFYKAKVHSNVVDTYPPSLTFSSAEIIRYEY